MRLAIAGIALASALVVGSAMAQSGSTSQGSMMSGGSMGHTMHQMGGANGSMHSMPATVTSVDQKTGIIEVNSEGMGLKLHFPPATLTKVKAGDKITLHMGFSKS